MVEHGAMDTVFMLGINYKKLLCFSYGQGLTYMADHCAKNTAIMSNFDDRTVLHI